MLMIKVRVCSFVMMLLSFLLSINSNAQVIFDSPKSPAFNYLTTQDLSLGYPTLNWSAPAFDPLYPNPTGYIIYRKEFSDLNPNGIYIAIDTVDNTTTAYTDNWVSINNARYTYVLASKGPAMPSQITSAHSNIFLKSEYDSCNNRLMLKWQPYEGWGNRIKKYDIYVGNNTDWSNYSLYTSLPGTSNTVTVLGVAENTDYYFYIEATKDGDQLYITKSNLLHKFTRMYPLVLSYSPSDNATNVLPNENLVLTFSGKVKQGTSGNITIYNSNATIFESIPYNDSRISISDNVVTINPSNSYLEGLSYYVKIDPNVITNFNGDSYSGIENNDVWNFTVSVLNSETVLRKYGISIFPNPTSGLVTIKVDNLNIEDVSVYDSKGMLKACFKNFRFPINPIDLSRLSKGIYFMKVQVNGMVIVEKLMVIN